MMRFLHQQYRRPLLQVNSSFHASCISITSPAACCQNVGQLALSVLKYIDNPMRLQMHQMGKRLAYPQWCIQIARAALMLRWVLGLDICRLKIVCMPTGAYRLHSGPEATECAGSGDLDASVLCKRWDFAVWLHYLTRDHHSLGENGCACRRTHRVLRLYDVEHH